MSFNVRMEVKNNTFPSDMKYAIVGVICQTIFSKKLQNNKTKISTILYNSLKEAYPDYNFQIFCIERNSNYTFLGEMSFNCTIQINNNAYIIGAIKSGKKAINNIPQKESPITEEEDTISNNQSITNFQ